MQLPFLSATFQAMAGLWSKSSYLPAVPAIMLAMTQDPHLVKLALPALLIGIVIFLLLNTKLVGTFGMRNSTLFIVAPIAVLGLVCTAMASDVIILLFGFFLQGSLGIFYSNSFAMLKNMEYKNTPKLVALITLTSTMLVPVGTVICGYLTHYSSWRYFFIFFAIVTVAITILTALIPSKIIPNAKSQNNNSAIDEYKQILTSKPFLQSILPVSLLVSAQYVFYILSPIIIIKEFGFSPKDYSFLMFIPLAGSIIGSALPMILSDYCNSYFLNKTGLVITVIGAVIITFMHDIFHLTIYELLFAVMIFMIGVNFVVAGSKSNIISLVPSLAGIAATILTISLNMMSALQGYIAAVYLENAMGAFILFLSLLASLLYFVFRPSVS